MGVGSRGGGLQLWESQQHDEIIAQSQKDLKHTSLENCA